MKQSRKSDPSNSLTAGKMRRPRSRKKASTEGKSTDNVKFIPENDHCIEDLLERFNFQYIFERVKQTMKSFPTLKHLEEEITSEVYVKFWQRLVKGPVDNPSAYISKMIHNRCIDHMRCLINEKWQFVQSYGEDDHDILENIHVTADTEGFRDPALEFEYKEAVEECYQRVSAAIALLPSRQQEASAWHLLRKVDDPQLLLQLFKSFHIALPKLHAGNKAEEHLLEASYNHAKKFLAKSFKVDLSQFRQKKRPHFHSLKIERVIPC